VDELAGFMKEQDCWSHIRPEQQIMDCHLAFLKLKDYFLGPTNVAIWLQGLYANLLLQPTKVKAVGGVLSTT